MMRAFLAKVEGMKPFTEKEAWTLFKLAAIGEAVGWSLLITGILLKRYVTHNNNDPVLIAGQLHGTLFIIYIAAVVVLYTSLRWSRKQTLVAGLASVPPYGSLVFEQWAAYRRRGEALKTYREVTVRALIIQGAKLLIIQPKDSVSWHIPGSIVQANETVETALLRSVQEQTGVTPVQGKLAYIFQHQTKHTQQLELFFVIANAKDFPEAALLAHAKRTHAIDEVAYRLPDESSELQPTFLQSAAVIKMAKNPNAPVQFIQNA